MANILNLPSEETFIEKMKAQNALLASIASNSGGISITSWADVQKIVRMGLAPSVFSIGDQLACNHTTYGNIVWDIIGIDHDEPVDKKYTHSLTLQSHDIVRDFIFDVPEPTNPDANRASKGSNNWLQSIIRQWLNSDGDDVDDWWKKQTEYDAKPGFASTMPAFLKGLDADFLSVIGEVYKDTALNTVTDGGGVKRSEEKFFLLSQTEVYGGTGPATVEGTAYPYYSENSTLSESRPSADWSRRKVLNGVAKYYWLRSPSYNESSFSGLVYPNGYIFRGYLSTWYGIVPACCIV